MLAGPRACGCAPACNRLALLRKCQGPFSEPPGSSGTNAKCGQVVASARSLDGLCTAPRVFLAPVRTLQCCQGIPAPDQLPGGTEPGSWWQGVGDLLGAGGQGGKGSVSPRPPISAALPEPLICGAWCLEEPWEFCSASSACSQTPPTSSSAASRGHVGPVLPHADLLCHRGPGLGMTRIMGS